MRVGVEVHVFSIIEGCVDRVVAGGGGVVHPVRSGRAGRCVKRGTFLGKLCAVDGHACLFFRGIDCANPSRDLDATVGNSTGAIRGGTAGPTNEPAFCHEKHDEQCDKGKYGADHDGLFPHSEARVVSTAAAKIAAPNFMEVSFLDLQCPHADPEIPELPYRLGEPPVSGGEALSVLCERTWLQECLISVPFWGGRESWRSLAFALQQGAFARAKDTFEQETRFSHT